jgi:hypothetical protein
MTTEFNKNLLCKDCKHAKASLLSRLTNISYGFKCTIPESWNEPEYDPVVGETVAGFFHIARVMRGKYQEACGPDAKKWVPSSTKKVFLYLKKG